MPGPVTDPRARALLRRYLDTFSGEEIPVPIESIAEDLLGLRVSEAELDCSGLLVPGNRRIWVNAAEARESPGRRRFTIAHEVGHWICQVLEGRWQPVYCREVEAGGNGYPPEEREANIFAGELLMPEAVVRDEFARTDSADEMATRFGTSAEAMRWRLHNPAAGRGATGVKGYAPAARRSFSGSTGTRVLSSCQSSRSPAALASASTYLSKASSASSSVLKWPRKFREARSKRTYGVSVMLGTLNHSVEQHVRRGPDGDVEASTRPSPE